MFPHVIARGGPFDRGVQHGEVAEGRIRAGLATYRGRFAAVGRAWEEVRRRCEDVYVPALAIGYPEGLEEMRGIGAGAGVPLLDVVALNARLELLRAEPECTLVASLRGPVLAAKNWDFHPSVRDTAIVLEVHPDEGPAVLMLAEAGQLGRDGLSAAGRAVFGSSLRSPDDGPGEGLPVSVLRRRLLASPWESAIAGLERAPRHVSSNVLVADASGKAVDIELQPGSSRRWEPEDGLLVHANHFVGEPGPGSSAFRAARVRELAGRGLREALSDHEGWPCSVCRHGEPGTSSVTVACLIVDCEERTFDVCEGPPCEGEFTRYRL